MGFEQQLQNAMFSQNSEKTFIDKVLARQEVDYLREIIKKPRLERADLLEILYLISGVESKLMNYSAWDRYVILKFFVWIREFVKQAEFLYDYRDRLEERERQCSGCEGYKDVVKGEKLTRCKCKEFTAKHTMPVRTRQLFDDAQRQSEHIVKFLIDLYLNIARTSLSTGATAFLELLTNKFEMAYPQLSSQMGQVQDGNTSKIWKR